MAVNRRMFTDEFKAEAVRLVAVEGHPARQVARDLDIHGCWFPITPRSRAAAPTWVSRRP
jgi:hypothetical protein